MLPPGGCRARREHRRLRAETREGGDERERGGDGVQGGPAGSLRGRTSAVTLANLLNMHCHSMSSRSGSPARAWQPARLIWPLFPCTRLGPTSANGAPPLGSASKLRPRAQAAGASARVVSTPCVCAVGLVGPTVEPCGDDRCVVARHATVQ